MDLYSSSLTTYLFRSFTYSVLVLLSGVFLYSDFFDLDMEVILSAAALALVTWTPGDM